MKAKVGDKVKFINDTHTGEVKSIVDERYVVVTCEDGFDYTVNLSEIIVLNEHNQITYKVDYDKIKEVSKKIKNHKSTDAVLSKYLYSSKYKYEGVVEVDLHLEELVDFPNKLEDWQKLHTQMQHVKRCIKAAVEQNIYRIVFVHGKGQGVLKTELINFLHQYPEITYKDADYREYGSGATEVIIKKT